MTVFETLVPDARAFLGALRENNSRDWFKARKSEYVARLREPAEALLAETAPKLGNLVGRPMETKLFRIERDVRFSKDKTPYNAHLHMLWREAGREAGPGWFLGIGLDYLRVGWGWMAWTPAQTAAWRDAMAGPRGETIDAAIRACGMEPRAPELKRVPAPFAADHAMSEHLRRKSLALWSDLADVAPAALMAEFARVEPLRAEIDGLL